MLPAAAMIALMTVMMSAGIGGLTEDWTSAIASDEGRVSSDRRIEHEAGRDDYPHEQREYKKPSPRSVDHHWASSSISFGADQLRPSHYRRAALEPLAL